MSDLYGSYGYVPSNKVFREFLVNPVGLITRPYKFYPVITKIPGESNPQPVTAIKHSDYSYEIRREPDVSTMNGTRYIKSDYTVSLLSPRDSYLHNTYGFFFDDFDIAHPSVCTMQHTIHVNFSIPHATAYDSLNYVPLPQLNGSLSILHVEFSRVDRMPESNFYTGDPGYVYPIFRNIGGVWHVAVAPGTARRDVFYGSGTMKLVIDTLVKPGANNSMYGLQLFDPNGTIIFDSGSEFITDVLDEITIDLEPGVSGLFNKTFEFRYPGYVITDLTRTINSPYMLGVLTSTRRRLRVVRPSVSYPTRAYGNEVVRLNVTYGPSMMDHGFGQYYISDIDRYIVLGYKKFNAS